jgi:hypothetical protein
LHPQAALADLKACGLTAVGTEQPLGRLTFGTAGILETTDQDVLIGVQNITLSTHGLEIDGIRGVGLDLATQSVDLDIDGALVAG